MNFNHIVCIIAKHDNDIAKQIVANKIAAISDPDPYWNTHVYTEDNWNKLKDSEGNITSWCLTFACTSVFANAVKDFNETAPIYPNIGAEKALIDVARKFMTITTEVRDINNKTQQLDLLNQCANNLGLSLIES